MQTTQPRLGEALPIFKDESRFASVLGSGKDPGRIEVSDYKWNFMLDLNPRFPLQFSRLHHLRQNFRFIIVVVYFSLILLSRAGPRPLYTIPKA